MSPPLPEVWSRLAPVAETHPGDRPPQLVLDLSALDFMDAAGLGAIVRLDNKIQSAGGSITIRSPKPLVRRVLELTCASQRLQVETEESPRREECRHG